jgi:CheY-like chemotaxis protein
MKRDKSLGRDMSGKNTAKILIIEDDPVAIAILKSRLKAKNYHVIVANTGEEGIKLAHQQSPDLILMDMVLPGMHGLEATIRLKNDPKTTDIPIFAVTAMGSSEFVEACQQDGICVFIKKPYDFRELLKQIHQYTYYEEREEKRVLIINDDPALVTLMASYLKEYGYLVISKPPRMFNVNQVRKVDPDVILLDIDLLEDWGIAIFEILKKTKSTKSIPVILMASQLTSEQLREIAGQLGAEDYVDRLFEFTEVDRKIKKVSSR